MKITYICSICGIEKTTYRSNKIGVSPPKYCSRKCKGVAHSINFVGSNNPNFANKWNDEQKAKQSFLVKATVNDEYRYKSGSANRGKQLPKDVVEKMHKNRTKESYSHPHSHELKKIIGQKSKDKWTDEYKIKFRQKMEDLGYWIPINEKSEYEIYHTRSNWIGSMVDFFTEEEITSLNSYGFFSFKNRHGYVRDHIVPRLVGYEFNVIPEILRHPANLQFISNRNNIQKGYTDRKLTQEKKIKIIIDLFDKILNYNKEWIEQDICVKFITERRHHYEKYFLR
jgi:hypothetical protein